MVVVTAVYTYELDMPLEQWNELSTDQQYSYVAEIGMVDTASISAEEVPAAS